MSELVEVRTDCACPDTRHPDGDLAYLYPSLPFEGGMAVTTCIAMASGKPVERIAAELGVLYVIHGLSHWNWTNGTGDAIPIGDNLRRDVPWVRMAPLADKAAELYSEEVWGPLVQRRSRSSRRSPTAASTSPRKRSSNKRR